ncbi:MAG: hypothetical protein ACHQNE_01610 [Candidatus Kapaibacterium sp.]
MAYFTVDELRIAAPCSADWASMEGNNYARHCGECKRNVYDLSMLTRAEGNELIREKEGHLCVKYYQRRDGTILTADCPVGLRALRRQYLRTRAKLVAAALAVWAVIAGTTSSCMQEVIGVPPISDSLMHHRDSITVPVHYENTTP